TVHRILPDRGVDGAASPRDVAGKPDVDGEQSSHVVLRWRARPDLHHQPRRAASMAATSIFFIFIIASKARFASPPPAANASVRTRGVICQDRPQRSLHQPHWLSWPPLPTIAFQ